MHMPGNPATPFSAFLLLSLFLFSGATDAQPVDQMLVEETGGAVKVRQQDAWESPAAGMVVHLPAVVSTGADGTVRLRQNETVVSVAANTAIELLPGPAAGQPLQRVVQKKGSAFYDVEAQKSRNFRVETPYLVAVVKGTQFDVTVTADASTVALYEGKLGIEAPDTGDAVDLHAGQIAKRHRDDERITVIDMDDGEPVARGATPGTGGSSGGDRTHVDGDGEAHPDSDGTFGIDGDIDLGDASVDADADLTEGDVDLDLDGDADLGGTSVDAGLDADADLTEGDVDLGLDADADLGDASVDAGLDADADLTEGDVDLGLDSDADLGDTSVDAGLDADADLTEGEVDLGLDGDADLGDTSVDAGLDADADLEEGEVDASADVAGVEADIGLDADGGLDDMLDADLDLLGESEEDTGTEEEDDEELLPDVGGLLSL